MGLIKKITKWVVNILTGILLLVLAMVIYGKCVVMFSNNAYPSYFGYTVFEIASGSMEPALYKNDVIIVKIDPNNFDVNDIIAFNNEGAVITHRVLFIDNDIITVKGDNNNAIDSPIKRDQVIGKVVKIIPKFGIWKKVVTEPKILIVIFVTLLLFDFALSYKPNSEEEKKKEKNIKKEIKQEINEEIEKEVNKNNKEDIKPKKKVLDVDIPSKEVISSEKNNLEKEKLLELTRKIDIVEINRLLDKDVRLSEEEAVVLKKNIKKMDDDFEEPMPKLKKKEKKFLEYTMRLDLSEIQKQINNNVK